MLKFDDKEIQLLTIKSVPPFISELFFEDIFNYPNVRACINIRDSISQEELIRWVNSQYQFLLSDRNTTKKLSDATELDTQKENFQILMNDIKNGDEKIKEVSLILVITGNKKEREDTLRELKLIADSYQIKLDIPRLRQMEAWQSYDITPNKFDNYASYLPTLTLGAGFPFTKTNFNDSKGFMFGVDIHTSLPIYFDPFTINNARTSHNMAIISSTGGGNYITIECKIDKSTYSVFYAHLYPDSYLVKEGDLVYKGQEIASVGTTGYSTGPHLHFQVSRNGTVVDGMGLINFMDLE